MPTDRPRRPGGSSPKGRNFDRSPKPFDRNAKPERGSRFDRNARPFDRDARSGDRPARPFDRDARSGDRPARPFDRDARSGDRPARPYDRDARPGDRPARPYDRDANAERGPRSYDDRGPKRGPKPDRFGSRPDRPGRAPRSAAYRPRPTQPVVETERGEDESETGNLVFGRHPSMAALEGDQAINKVWILKTLANQELVAKLRELAKEKGAVVQMVERQKLDALSLNANHQGIVVSLSPTAYQDLDEVVALARASEFPALLLLDGIVDPHNLGALIRTAEGAGFQGVIIPSRRAVGVTGVAFKASAGAAARMPVARVGNMATAIETLKNAGFWLVGAEAEGTQLPYEVDMTQPIALVIGSEGKGLGRLLGEKCDFRVKLPLGGELESLNASVAGGVLMYEAVRQRWAKGQ